MIFPDFEGNNSSNFAIDKLLTSQFRQLRRVGELPRHPNSASHHEQRSIAKQNDLTPRAPIYLRFSSRAREDAHSRQRSREVFWRQKNPGYGEMNGGGYSSMIILTSMYLLKLINPFIYCCNNTGVFLCIFHH